MNTVTVYRIETCLSSIKQKERSHIGFFCGRLFLKDFMDESIATEYSNKIAYNLGYFPEPEEDGIYNFSYNHIFGFGCSKQLLKVNISLIRTLGKCGYILTEYELDKKHVVYGKCQVAFMSNRAKLINIHDPLEYIRKLRQLRREEHYE